MRSGVKDGGYMNREDKGKSTFTLLNFCRRERNTNIVLTNLRWKGEKRRGVGGPYREGEERASGVLEFVEGGDGGRDWRRWVGK